jgi:outer membrane autotransporter protein
VLSLKKVLCLRAKPNMLVLALGLTSPVLWAQQASYPPGHSSGDSQNSDVVDLLEPDASGSSTVLVDGRTETVMASTPATSYYVMNGGILSVLKDGVVNAVAINHSKVIVDDGSVKEGIVLSSGDLKLVNATVENDKGSGLLLLLTKTDLLSPSTAHITDSSITGKNYGMAVGTTGEAWLVNSTVRGMNEDGTPASGGMRLSGGAAHVMGNSHISGDVDGVYIVNGASNIIDQDNHLEIDQSSVSGGTGAAIKVNRLKAGAQPTVAEVTVSNGSTLSSGSGLLMDVLGGSTANVEVNNSILTGNFVADDTSTLNTVLRNHGQLNGNIVNGDSVIIDSSGRWQFAADNRVESLALDGGSVGFTGEGFHSLSLGQLSGRGVFDMRINLDNGTGDLLSVNGEATGRYRLRVQNTGLEAVPAEFDPLRVVHTESGDAEFGLVGGRADLGVYSYGLERQGTDWFIVGEGKEISPSTHSALALFNTAPTVWNSELTTLRSRMGEVRGQAQGGGWMRTYGSRFNASLDSGVNYSQKQQGLSFGADAPVPVGNGQLLLGLMGGYSKSDLDIGRGTTGEVDSYYVGAYGTWLSEGGYYVDAVLKLNQFHNESKVAMSDGTKAKGDYSSKAVGGSLEVGKHIKLNDEYFVEPFAQVSSVWIDGSSYTLDNGMQARTRQTQSVLGKVGSTVGRSFAMKDGGVVKPYARVALAQEFSRSNDVSVNGQRFDNDLFGSRAELGAGVSVSLSERLQVHADFDYMKGEHVEQPWGANVGLRLAF